MDNWWLMVVSVFAVCSWVWGSGCNWCHSLCRVLVLLYWRGPKILYLVIDFGLLKSDYLFLSWGSLECGRCVFVLLGVCVSVILSLSSIGFISARVVAKRAYGAGPVLFWLGVIRLCCVVLCPLVWMFLGVFVVWFWTGHIRVMSVSGGWRGPLCFGCCRTFAFWVWGGFLLFFVFGVAFVSFSSLLFVSLVQLYFGFLFFLLFFWVVSIASALFVFFPSYVSRALLLFICLYSAVLRGFIGFLLVLICPSFKPDTVRPWHLFPSFCDPARLLFPVFFIILWFLLSFSRCLPPDASYAMVLPIWSVSLLALCRGSHAYLISFVPHSFLCGVRTSLLPAHPPLLLFFLVCLFAPRRLRAVCSALTRVRSGFVSGPLVLLFYCLVPHAFLRRPFWPLPIPAAAFRSAVPVALPLLSLPVSPRGVVLFLLLLGRGSERYPLSLMFELSLSVSRCHSPFFLVRPARSCACSWSCNPGFFFAFASLFVFRWHRAPTRSPSLAIYSSPVVSPRQLSPPVAVFRAGLIRPTSAWLFLR